MICCQCEASYSSFIHLSTSFAHCWFHKRLVTKKVTSWTIFWLANHSVSKRWPKLKQNLRCWACNWLFLNKIIKYIAEYYFLRRHLAPSEWQISSSPTIHHKDTIQTRYTVNTQVWAQRLQANVWQFIHVFITLRFVSSLPWYADGTEGRSPSYHQLVNILPTRSARYYCNCSLRCSHKRGMSRTPGWLIACSLPCGIPVSWHYSHQHVRWVSVKPWAHS